MAYEHKENSGSTFNNDRRTSDSQPHFTGTAKVGGKLYRMSTWVKEGKAGKFYSHSFTAADETPVRQGQPKPVVASDDSFFDDTLGF